MTIIYMVIFYSELVPREDEFELLVYFAEEVNLFMTLENLSGKPKESHEVRAIKFDLETRQRREVNIRLNSSGDQNDLLGKGAEGSVTRVTASVGGRETAGSLAFKQYRNEGQAVHAKRVWMHLKSLGIPVPKTYRLILDGSEKDGIYEGALMTELTDDWNTIFLTTRPGNRRMINKVYDTNPEIVRQFANQDFESDAYKQVLLAKCREIAKKLTDAGILLRGGDVMGATYKQNGSLEPVLFDYGNVALDGREHVSSEPLNKADLLEKNQHCAELIAFAVAVVQEDARDFLTNQPT